MSMPLRIFRDRGGRIWRESPTQRGYVYTENGYGLPVVNRTYRIDDYLGALRQIYPSPLVIKEEEDLW